MIFLGLFSLAMLSHAFPTEKREVFSNFFNVNAAVHPDLKGMFDMCLGVNLVLKYICIIWPYKATY